MDGPLSPGLCIYADVSLLFPCLGLALKVVQEYKAVQSKYRTAWCFCAEYSARNARIIGSNSVYHCRMEKLYEPRNSKDASRTKAVVHLQKAPINNCHTFSLNTKLPGASAAEYSARNARII